MIKVFCDCCKEEQTGFDFSFEAAKQQIITNLINGQPTLEKVTIQICKSCFNKHFSKIWEKILQAKNTK